MGAALGLGMMTKYNMAFLIAGILAGNYGEQGAIEILGPV
jgi:4-amino-4-deoxy-L-arabinose transferase-like glycosyltransferase